MKTRMRYLLKIGALLLALVVLGGVTLPGRDVRLAAAPGMAPAEQMVGGPMPALQEASCTVVGTVRTCELWAVAGSLTMPDLASLPVWGFATSGAGPALVPGPVISATVGETLEVVLHNDLAGQTVALAFPGQELIPDLEGVAAGETATYTIEDLAAGTFLYEAGLTPGGARQVVMGMAGPLIVNDAAPAWDQEIVLVLNEFDPDLNDDPLIGSTNTFRPKYWLLNGLAWPDTGYTDVVSGTTVLLRYLNAGVQHHTLGLLGLQQSVIAADGEALPFPQGAIAPAIAPGQTLEALVSVPDAATSGTLYPLYNASLHQHNNGQRLADGRAAFGGMLTFLRIAGEPPISPLGIRLYLPVVRQDSEPPEVPDEVAPSISGMSLTPNPTNGTVDVLLGATADDRATGDSPVVAAEYRIDGGAWQPMALGVPGTSVKELTATILTDTLQLLSEGVHVVEVRAQDDWGNWTIEPGAVDLLLDTTGPNVPVVSLSPNALDLTQPVTVTSVHLTGTVEDPLSNGVQSTLVNAEGFIDTVSAPGTGFDLFPTDGLFDEGAEDVYYDIPVSHFGTLPGGAHTVHVVGRDRAGNWGVAGSATITITVVDNDGPVVSELSITTLPGNEILLEGLATDALSYIDSAVWYLETDPATQYPMSAADGAFDSLSEAVQATIAGVDQWGPGPHTIWVVAIDFAGNGGEPVSIAYPE